jgi:transposase InsO family protein
MVQDREAAFAPDLVERDFVIDRCNQLWVAHIMYVPTWVGFLWCLAGALDAHSKKVIGRAMETR